MEITITGAAARKIGRLSALYPEAEVRIAGITGYDDEAAEAVSVEFLDAYGAGPHASTVTGQRCEHAFVVRDTGWSNPSLTVARDRQALAKVRA